MSEASRSDAVSGAGSWAIVLGLSLGPAISNGFARFAYGLILPAMRDDLGWSYTEAGWLNTANAVGYLIGAVLALTLISRLGARWLYIWGFALTVLALAFSATTRDIGWLSFWRVLAGIGGAPVFIAGGVIASTQFAGDKRRNALAIAVYFGGGGLGMVLTAAALPPFMDWFGNPGWPLVWLMLAVAAYVAFIPSWLAADAGPDPSQPRSGPPPDPLPLRAMTAALVTYFLFGLGYLIYITFLVAWMREHGADTAMIVWTWTIMGVGVMASPFLWQRVLARAEGGLAMALTSLTVGIGIVAPLTIEAWWGALVSAALVGGSFFMIPTSVTSFFRKNLHPEQWGPAMSLFTVVFSVGQIVGPIGGGMLSDLSGGTSDGLMISGLIVLAGAISGALQRPLDGR